jgi:hypothetical protein
MGFAYNYCCDARILANETAGVTNLITEVNIVNFGR